MSAPHHAEQWAADGLWHWRVRDNANNVIESNSGFEEQGACTLSAAAAYPGLPMVEVPAMVPPAIEEAPPEE